MRKNITAKLIDSLQPRHDRRYEVRDVGMPGFGVRISVTGSKTFFVMGRVGERQTRHTIGTYPILSLADAREVARSVLREVQLGTYGQNEATEKPITLGQAMGDFIELIS